MAQFARQDLQALSAVVLVDLASDYSLELSRIFREHFTSSGGEVVAEVEYKKNADFDKVVDKILPLTADVIFFSGHEEGGSIARKLQQAGETATLLGGDGWSDRSFFDKGGNQLRSGYYCTHWSTDSDRQTSRNFVEKYGTLRDFGIGAALAYDAVMVLADAMTSAGTTDGEAVAEALLTIKNYEGVTGAIQFNSTGDPVKHGVIMKIIDGAPHFHKSFSAQ